MKHTEKLDLWRELATLASRALNEEVAETARLVAETEELAKERYRLQGQLDLERKNHLTTREMYERARTNALRLGVEVRELKECIGQECAAEKLVAETIKTLQYGMAVDVDRLRMHLEAQLEAIGNARKAGVAFEPEMVGMTPEQIANRVHEEMPF